MAVTSSQVNANQSLLRMATGSYVDTGTAAAVTFTTGFQPRYVRVSNETGDSIMEWYEGMANGEGMKLVGDTDPVTYAKVDSNGITVSATGFTFGLDTDVNVTSQTVQWYALG